MLILHKTLDYDDDIYLTGTCVQNFAERLQKY